MNTQFITSTFAFLILAFMAMPAYAQTSGSPAQPLEISADDTLEWDRNNQIFTAQTNAIAKQGELSIEAGTITAKYRESEGKNIDIHTMTAVKNVIIRNQESAAYGEKAIYEMDKGLAIMTGNNLRMVSDGQTLTASESFKYWTEEGRLIATGNAVITRPTDTLKASVITATFTQNDSGKRILNKVKADGNVIITTASETLTGDYGTYSAKSNTAEITGNVKITRGPNILVGTKAQIDLTTNISRMFGSTSGDGRVKGIFYPGSK